MNKKEFSHQANMPYPYPMPYQDNDEIDLVELFRTLWKQKAKITLITVATTLAAGIYAFTAEEVWTSKAVITEPKASDMGEFYQLAQNLERNAPKVITSNGMQISEEYAKTLQFANLQRDVFTEFTEFLDSLDERRKFIVSTDYYKEKIKGKSEREQKLMLQTIAEGNINHSAAGDNKIKIDTISFSANSPQQAQFLLQGYMGEINNKVIENNEAKLNMLLSKFQQDLDAESNSLVSNGDELLKKEINAVSSALAQAKGMRLSETAVNFPAEINNTTMYLLGSKVLTEKLALLQVSTPIFPSRYFEIQQQLKILNSIKVKLTKSKSFTYIDEPSEPVMKDKPKKTLILIFGVILGFMLGCLSIVCFSIANKKIEI